MSEELVALLLTFGILAALFAWVPALDRVCPPCGRLIRRMRGQPEAMAPPLVSTSEYGELEGGPRRGWR